MTALPSAPAWLPAMEKWRSYGGWLSTVRIAGDGRVVIHTVRVVARPGPRSTIELWPMHSNQRVLGRVDTDDPHAWQHAEAIVRTAGYVPCDSWTTVERMPAVRVMRDGDHPAGPCASLIFIGLADPLACRLPEGHDGSHAHKGVTWADDL